MSAGSEMTISTIPGGSGTVVVVVEVVDVVAGTVVEVVVDGTDVVVVLGRVVVVVVVVVVGGSVEGVASGPLVPQAVAASTRIAGIPRSLRIVPVPIGD